MQDFCDTIPREIEEAAEIDGASRMQIFVYVVLPLVRPGIAAVAILGLINVWNDYLTVAVFAPDAARRTLQVAIVNQVLDSNGISWSYMMAFVLVESTPVVLMFLRRRSPGGGRRQDAGDDLQWAPPPGDTAPGKQTVFGFMLVINAKSADANQAWKFVSFMTSPEGEAIQAQGGEVIARASVYSDPYFTSPEASNHKG